MTELFIEKSKLVHGDRYDYSKVDYNKSKANIIITCKVHGDFLQTPNNHLRGANCNKKKSPLNEFIKRCNEIHGYIYDYSKVDYIDANTKIIIICKEHGEFYKTPSKHTNAKQGCAKCSGYYIPTTDEFIENARLVHGDKYNYSKVDYKYSYENVIITCKIHGDFLQRPGNHIKSKQGCPKCGGSCKSNTIEFIEKSIKIHGDIYDYSKVNYIDATSKIIISCKFHGDFEQQPYSHLNGHGCYMCCKNRKLNTIEFIDRSNIIHNNKYDYSKVDYKYSDENIIVICKIHGEFEQTPNSHLQGRGCNKCGVIIRSNKARNTLEEFIEKAILVHGDKYDYSKVDYVSRHTNIIIICKIHGEFEQDAGNHLLGANCYKCSNNGFSKSSILWLDFLSKYYNINIQHAENDREYLIPETKYRADGFCKENNTIYEFHGDFWHGNPNIYKDNDINIITKCTYKELYDKTLIRENKIKELGYNLITIWENDWKKINKCIKILQQKFRKYKTN
jgi:hypothetical protein